MRRSIGIAVVALMAGLAAAGCSSDSSNSSSSSATTSDRAAASSPSTSAAAPIGSAPAEVHGTLRYATTSIPTSMDPATAGLDANLVYLTAVYDGLIGVSPSGGLQPMLATEWSLSDDGLTFDMVLRSGVTFQDGKVFDAAAVVANIEHFQADGSLLAASLGLVDSVEAIDATHVRFHLNRPGGDLPELLRGYAGLMASPAAIAAGTLPTQPVGAGPFKVLSISDSLVSYERWDDYWDADRVGLAGLEISVMLDDIARLNAVRSGQLDLTFIRPDQVAEAEAAGLTTAGAPRVLAYGLSLNPSLGALADGAVRKAISRAIDRESINEFLYDGACTPTVQMFPEEYWAYSSDVDEAELLTLDQEGARQAITAAAPDGLKLTLLVSAITAYQRLAEVLQQQLAEVGVTVTIETVDTSDREVRRRAGDYGAILSPLYPANPDPSTFAEQFYRVAPGSSEYVDPALPGLIADARLTVDRQARAAAIGEITETVLAAGTPTIGICLPTLAAVFDDDVTGVTPELLGGLDFRSVRLAG